MQNIQAAALCLLCLLSSFLVSGEANAARVTGTAPRPDIAGFTIEQSTKMRGKKMPWDHEIQVALPPSYHKSNRTYPVLWVTDGHYAFESAIKAAASLDADIPEMIIVAIGTPADAIKEGSKRRVYDFTASKSLKQSTIALGSDVRNQALLDLYKPRGYAVWTKHGGARDFLTFLTGQLRSSIAKTYRISDVHTLLGHSAGGLFCTYALLSSPDAFNMYICGSADLYIDDSHIFGLEKQYARKHDDLKAGVFLSFGEAEITQKVIGGLGIASSTARMAEILNARNYPSLDLHMKVFPGDNHSTVFYNTVYWGLRTLWQP